MTETPQTREVPAVGSVDQLRRTAHHEAGHSVAAYVLGRGPLGASIEPGRHALGVSFSRGRKLPDADIELAALQPPPPLLPGRFRREFEGRICVALAGVAAEPLAWGKTRPPGRRLRTPVSEAPPALAAARPDRREAARLREAVEAPGESDEEVVWSHASLMLGEDIRLVGAFVRFQEEVVRSLVERHADTIRALAAELLDHGALSGRRVREVCRGVCP